MDWIASARCSGAKRKERTDAGSGRKWQRVASIAYREAGGDGISDDIAHGLRSESGRNLPVTGKIEKLLNRPADHTSFGPLNIQERRAAQILGYGDIGTMSETARRTLASTTKDPTAAIFMAAQHIFFFMVIDLCWVIVLVLLLF